MTAASNLFLVTNTFPVGTGEDFIASEIGELALRFDQVVIVATRTKPSDAVTRTVPDNVRVIRAGGPRPTGSAALLAAARGLVHLPRSSWTRDIVHVPRRLGTEAMFEAHARSTEAELLASIPALRLRPGSHAVVYSYWFLDTARVAALLAADLRAHGVVVDRLVSRAHRYDLYESEAPNGHLPERQTLLASFDAVCPISEQGARTLAAEWPAYSEKIHNYRLGTSDPHQLARCTRKPFHIISCAYLSPVKRMARMPAILHELRERGVDVRWTHLGDGSEMDTIRRELTIAGVEDAADLRGSVANDEIINIERELEPSCLINLSASEGIPVSMMEAASLGIPIIGTDVGGVSEIAADNVNGRLIAPDFTDSDAADALQWLAELPDDNYRDVCRASRSIWQTDYDQAVVYPRFCTEVLGAD